jgi:hypothetical protein
VGEQAVHRQKTGAIESNETGHISRWNRRTHERSFDGALFDHQIKRGQSQHAIGSGQADGNCSPAAARGRIRLGEHLLTAHGFDRILHAAMRELAHKVDRIRIAGVDTMGGPQFTGQCELVRGHIDGNQWIGPGSPSSQQRRQSDTPEPEYGDALAGGDLCRIDHGADSGHDSTPE